MARVLMVGVDPDEVDFSDPALPPGLDADKIRAGIAHSLKQLAADGHIASHMYVSADPAKLMALANHLNADTADCVTIGGGVTRPPQHIELLEAVLNIIGRADPTPRIALVVGPANTPAAVKRVLG